MIYRQSAFPYIDVDKQKYNDKLILARAEKRFAKKELWDISFGAFVLFIWSMLIVFDLFVLVFAVRYYVS